MQPTKVRGRPPSSVVRSWTARCGPGPCSTTASVVRRRASRCTRHRTATRSSWSRPVVAPRIVPFLPAVHRPGRGPGVRRGRAASREPDRARERDRRGGGARQPRVRRADPRVGGVRHVAPRDAGDERGGSGVRACHRHRRFGSRRGPTRRCRGRADRAQSRLAGRRPPRIRHRVATARRGARRPGTHRGARSRRSRSSARWCRGSRCRWRPRTRYASIGTGAVRDPRRAGPGRRRC